MYSTVFCSPNAGYGGAAFDGEFVYFVPQNGRLLLRFDARTPSAPSPVYPGAP